MIHKWNHKPRYGIEQSYVIGMKWLDECSLVEDWGCALCYAKKYCVPPYRGVDGTKGKADIIADLCSYTSDADGIFMRHILEHNPEWRILLGNALSSFQSRMTLIMFRPFSDKGDVTISGKWPGNVDIDIDRKDFDAIIKPYLVSETKIKTDTVFLLQKS